MEKTMSVNSGAGQVRFHNVLPSRFVEAVRGETKTVVGDQLRLTLGPEDVAVLVPVAGSR
jgi:hypothetical protein